MLEDPLSLYIPSTEHIGLDDLPQDDGDHVQENEGTTTNGHSINNQTSVGGSETSDIRQKRSHGQKRVRDSFNNIIASATIQIGNVANAIANQPSKHVNVTELLVVMESVEGLNEESLDFCLRNLLRTQWMPKCS